MEIYYHQLINLLAAVILGLIIGFERELQGKFAGLRTHLLVSLGSALFVMLAKQVPNESGRIIAQVISGIGFIGAAAVIKENGDVIGLTTAACLWICAAIGIACGLGQIILAVIVTGISVIGITILNIIGKFINERKTNNNKQT